ncbi:MAG TPA: hypothetical protein P5168_04250, partial [Candidatus Methanomethylicus sp.]|nr:hypothetical protein [Candidatus Methanomethylicus sp.]
MTVLKENTAFKTTYIIEEPYVYSAIVEDPATKELLYRIIEPTLTSEERALYERIKKILMQELNVDVAELSTERAPAIIEKEVRRII